MVGLDKMKDYTELLEQLKKVCEGVSEMAGHSDDWTTHDWLCYETGLDSIEAIRELQERNIELLSYAEKLDEHEAKLQGKIEALQEQVNKMETDSIHAIFLTKIGMNCVVAIEREGEWIPVIHDNQDTISHIVEPLGIKSAIAEHTRNKVMGVK